MPGSSHIALLRGINVGGRNRLPMKDLVAVFGDAGCADVRSYIQSGNVVFRAPAALARRLPAHVAETIESRFGLRVPVVLRTRAEWRRVVDANPFLSATADVSQLSVAFLATKPGAALIRQLDPDRSPPDAFAVVGREIYLRCPNGARSKLTNQYFDSRLDTVSTVRNWKTTLKLAELVAQ